MSTDQYREASASTVRDASQKLDPAAEKALSWYGWGSPIGLGIFVLTLSLSAVVIHYAWIMR